MTRAIQSRFVDDSIARLGRSYEERHVARTDPHHCQVCLRRVGSAALSVTLWPPPTVGTTHGLGYRDGTTRWNLGRARACAMCVEAYHLHVRVHARDGSTSHIGKRGVFGAAKRSRSNTGWGAEMQATWNARERRRTDAEDDPEAEDSA